MGCMALLAISHLIKFAIRKVIYFINYSILHLIKITSTSL